MNTSSRFPNIQEHANVPAQGEKWPCVMVDIETLATSDDAVILEIAAVCFNRDGGKMGPLDSWQLDHLLQDDREMDAETVRWWLAPERAATFAELTGKSGLPELWHGLHELVAFLERHLAEGGEIWAKGDFDLRILENAMKFCDVPVPWMYFQKRELRTVLKLAGMASAKDTAHRAEDDARGQVEQLWEAQERLARVSLDGAVMEAGWEAYREELAETRAILLPAWEAVHADVQEAWCVGVRAAIEAGVRWRAVNG